MPAPVLIIHTGDPNEELKSAYGSYAAQLQRAAGLSDDEAETICVFQGDCLPPPQAYRAALITSSPTMVTDQLDWSERAAEWLRHAAAQGLPMFGICYGHQLLSHAFGGTVGYNPAGRAAGTMTVQKLAAAAGEALLHETPDAFPAHMLHTQAVLQPPCGATVLASSPLDPHHMLRLAPHIFSAQFHPEFSPEFVRAHLSYYAEIYRGNGIDAIAMREQVSATPQSAGLLRRFLQLHGRQATATTATSAAIS